MLPAGLAAAHAANRENADGSSRDMDTSMLDLDKRHRPMSHTIDTGEAVRGNIEKRPSGDAPEISLAVDLEVAKGRAHRWTPELVSRGRSGWSCVSMSYG